MKSLNTLDIRWNMDKTEKKAKIISLLQSLPDEDIDIYFESLANVSQDKEKTKFYLSCTLWEPELIYMQKFIDKYKEVWLTTNYENFEETTN